MPAGQQGRLDRASALAAWSDPVVRVRLVDAARAEALARLDVHTVGDLIAHYPFRYLDLTRLETLATVRTGSEATVVGRVHEVKLKKPKPRLTIVEVTIVDGTGTLIGVWFNQPYRQQQFAAGERVAFAGKVTLGFEGIRQIQSPYFEKLPADEDPRQAARIIPVHHTTEGLTANWLRRLVESALEEFGDVPDHLPASLRSQLALVPLRAAVAQMHFPKEMQNARDARRRLAFDELFVLQVGLAMRRHRATLERAGISHRIGGASLAALVASMPFTPTADQERAIAEVLDDMASPRPMNRMLLGDVGTGKTLVAAHALCAVADTGSQTAMMAPTEVLAIQYAEKVGPLLDAAGVRWGLLTGSTLAAERRTLMAAAADGSLQVLFGTHALLEESVSLKRLSLAVVDEQHRFGVSQRLGLRAKGAAADLLVMTATPIPRSLALTLYGDLDTSYLRTRPTRTLGAQQVTTRLVSRAHREEAYERVREEVHSSRQAYVVCALVEEGANGNEAKAATKEAERLRAEVFPDLRVGLLTGRMRPAEKVAVMREFRDGAIDVLVSTTVIEVGVDVPNATVMIVEDAERFGLAQLHQLRGRIGRGEHAGEFLLFADARSPESRERMQAIVRTNDGFELAEYDMRLRGEGHLLGERQHGMPALRVASLLGDSDLLDLARSAAGALISQDPHLTRPEHGPLALAVQRWFAESWEWVSSG
jgi:ATP-dependent DNA helicase RecG